MIRLHLRIQGTVQGVGFRPRVLREATARGLSGWVRNGPDGVHVEVQGPSGAVLALVEGLERAPPPARVDRVERDPRPLSSDEPGFRILASAGQGAPEPVLPDDLVLCAACAAEARDPADRRHDHAFTACTDCGPRTSIALHPPFDRARSAMAGFPLCATCAAEYADPGHRRFHAQVSSCPACGPTLSLVDRQGRVTATGGAALDGAADVLREGGLLGLKGVGGFQLLCDPGRPEALARLRALKARPDKPLAVMLPSLEDGAALGLHLSQAASLLRDPAGPIVLVPAPGSPLQQAVAPGLADVGLMLPTSALHLRLLDRLGQPMVCTSANRRGSPLATTLSAALADLGEDVDAWLDHDRPILRPLDDSVLRVGRGRPLPLRRARGLSARPLPLRAPGPTVLALGAHLAVAPALSVGSRAFVAPHVGDLEGRGSLWRFGQACRTLVEDLATGLEAVACDAHPDLPSTRFAEALAAEHGVPLRRVPHHHAHVAAVIAEHHLEGPVLGLAWDGYGMGEAGEAWGGEALRCEGAAAERVGHLLPFPLAGGDRAARQPARVALALLHGAGLLEAPEAARWRERAEADLGEEIAQGVGSLLVQGQAGPPTSSVGRLFDGIAWLCGGPARITWEGQAAAWLEARATAGGDRPALALPVERGRVDWRALVPPLLAALRRGDSVPDLARAFHLALAGAAADLARGGPRDVVLAGGCFQNLLLGGTAEDRLQAAGHRVHRARLLPPGDGGLALGQLHLARLWEG